MYNRKKINIGIVFFVVIMLIRLTTPTSYGLVNFILLQIPIFLGAAALAFIGSNLKRAIKDSGNQPANVIVSFIMFIAFWDLLVWIFILAGRNPGLSNLFVFLIFLPYGYFFIPKKKAERNPYAKEIDIFDTFERDYEEDDIFDVYLREQKEKKDKW